MRGARVLVSPDNFGGFRVRVVHPELARLDGGQRRELLLAEISDKITTAELVTPDEEEWYGVAFSEPEGHLPLWPEAFGRPEERSQLLFASDLDEDLPLPIVATFYSLRGGVGRTTALANAARILAARGRRVLCIDLDLEAPGLHTLLEIDEPSADMGALPLLLTLEQGGSVDIRDHVYRVTEADELYCIPAGQLGTEYARRLRLIDPEIWYRESANPLRRLVELAKESSLEPDLVLIDSRTGISPISAPLLFDLSDLAVVCFFPHVQAGRGNRLLVRALLNAESRRTIAGVRLTPEPRFLVSPVPPGPSAREVTTRALQWIENWLEPAQQRRTEETGPLVAEELAYAVSYSPEAAFRDRVPRDRAAREPYEPVADWLEQLLPLGSQIAPEQRAKKQQILVELEFSPGAAESRDRFLDDYVVTPVVAKAMEPRYPLVVGRKGSGKTALFRWLLESGRGAGTAIPVTCADALRHRYPWALGATGFAAIEGSVSGIGGWNTFWACYTALSVYLSLPDGRRIPPPGRLRIDLGPLEGDYTELDVVNALRSLLQVPDAGLAAAGWLQDLGDAQGRPRYLLFDGLDTGFGNDPESRLRRARAVGGLFVFLAEAESRVKSFRFKIMVRADIWHELRFENKNHFHGRSVQLRWHDQAEYLETALKQAVRSPSFRGLLDEVDIGADVDSWGDREIFHAWNLLVGERMRGGKTTFTRDWVWNQLADGQGGHGPGSLSQLLREAVDWEIREEPRNPYSRSIIRPRAFVPSLREVGDQALRSLLEEFPELDSLVASLRFLGRSPLDPADILESNSTAAGQLDLALEVGLLEIYEGTVGDVRRYRVPDLYGRSLWMARRG